MIESFLDQLPYHYQWNLHWRDNFELRGVLSSYLALMRDKGIAVQIDELAESLIVLSDGDADHAVEVLRYSFLKGLYPVQAEAWKVYYADPEEE